jgi:hypothetical protein
MASRCTQLVCPFHGWTVAADNHTGFHSNQLKIRRSVSSGNAITNTGQLSGKTLPSPINPCSCCVMLKAVRIWCKQHETMAPSCLVSSVQASGRGVVVWGMFSWHTLGPMTPIVANCINCTLIPNVGMFLTPCRIHSLEEFRLFWRQRGSNSIVY